MESKPTSQYISPRTAVPGRVLHELGCPKNEGGECDCYQAVIARQAEALEAARKFLAKVDEITPHIDGILALQQIRAGQAYNGPNWKAEYEALAALLKERM